MLSVVRRSSEIFVFFIGYVPAIEPPGLVPFLPLIGTPGFSSMSHPFG
jgi:hypothetical protein